MKCKPSIRHFQPPKFQCFSSQFALHGLRAVEKIGKPQMWERAHVGFGGTGRKRKGPCTKQCAWRKHGSSDTRLAEACPLKLRNTVKYRVEEMRPKWPFWKHRAPKMRLVEAQCAHRKHCYPEIPLGSPPTSRALQKEVSRNTFWSPKGPARPCGTLPRTPPHFRGHSWGHSGTLRAHKTPERLPNIILSCDSCLGRRTCQHP